jgi:hypothetical protein
MKLNSVSSDFHCILVVIISNATIELYARMCVFQSCHFCCNGKKVFCHVEDINCKY